MRTVPSDVVLGGRKVAVQRPRVRADGREVPLPTFQALAHTDPLNRRVVDQMLVGVATRQYARSLAPVPGVVARIVPGPHEAHRQDPHLPMRYDTGRPRAVIRFRISQPRTTSLPCPAGLRARRPSPMMDL